MPTPRHSLFIAEEEGMVEALHQTPVGGLAEEDIEVKERVQERVPVMPITQRSDILP